MKAHKKRGEAFNDVVIPLPDDQILRCRFWKGEIYMAAPNVSTKQLDEYEMQWPQVKISNDLVDQLLSLEKAQREARPAIRSLNK